MTCKGCGKKYIKRHKRDHRCQDCYISMGKRNKRKGNASEHRFAKYIQSQFNKYELPYKARRTPRSGAIHEFEPADVMINGPDSDSFWKKIHIENKNTASWHIEDWFKKAKELEIEVGKNRQPCLIIRKPQSHNEFAVIDSKFLVELLIIIDLLNKQNEKD